MPFLSNFFGADRKATYYCDYIISLKSNQTDAPGFIKDMGFRI